MVSVVKVILLVLAIVLILATVLPFIKAPYWWIRMFDFPRAQIAVAVRRLLDRLPGLRLTDEQAALPSGTVMRGPMALPVVW